MRCHFTKVPYFESPLQNTIILVRDIRLSNQKGEAAHLRVLLNACRLIPNARLVHLRSNYLEQIESIVDASSREALNFFSALAGVLHSCNIRVGELLASRSDGARSCRLGLPTFLGARLRCGLLYAQSRGLLLCEQARVLGFALEICFAFLLLVLLAFNGFGAVGPLVGFLAFLGGMGCSQ